MTRKARRETPVEALVAKNFIDSLRYGRTGQPQRFIELNTAIAAFRPLIAMTLPPGWVQAPHRKTPSIGVRYGSLRDHIYCGKHSPWKMCPPVRPTFFSM